MRKIRTIQLADGTFRGVKSTTQDQNTANLLVTHLDSHKSQDDRADASFFVLRKITWNSQVAPCFTENGG